VFENTYFLDLKNTTFYIFKKWVSTCVREYVFYVFFQNPKNMTYVFFLKIAAHVFPKTAIEYLLSWKLPFNWATTTITICNDVLKYYFLTQRHENCTKLTINVDHWQYICDKYIPSGHIIHTTKDAV